MFHRSERLFLRPAWPEDWKAIAQEIRMAEEYLLPEPRRLAKSAAHANGEHAPRPNWRTHEPVSPNFILTLPEPTLRGPESGIIGWAALLRNSPDDSRELGVKLWVDPAYRGQGFGSECLGALMAIGTMLGTETVYTLIPDQSRGAQAMVDKAGFTHVSHVNAIPPSDSKTAPQFPAFFRDGADKIMPAHLYRCELSKLSAYVPRGIVHESANRVMESAPG